MILARQQNKTESSALKLHWSLKLKCKRSIMRHTVSRINLKWIDCFGC